MEINRKNKKAQEEIVGFVAIVVVVALIGLVFLGISLRSDSDQNKESNDLRRFVESSLTYTTDCAFNYEPNYASLRDLLKSCYKESGRKCLNGKDVCSALNSTLQGLLDSSWTAGEDRKVKGYEFESYFSLNITAGDNENIITLRSGNCSGLYSKGESFFAADRGSITSSLKVCS